MSFKEKRIIKGGKLELSNVRWIKKLSKVIITKCGKLELNNVRWNVRWIKKLSKAIITKSN